MKRFILITGAAIYLLFMLICFAVNAQNATTGPIVHIHTVKDFKGKVTVKDTSFRMDSSKAHAFMQKRGPHHFRNDSAMAKRHKMAGDSANRKMAMAKMHRNGGNKWAANHHAHFLQNADSISITRKFTIRGDSMIRETRRIVYFKPSPNNKNIKTADTLIKMNMTVHKGIKPGDMPDANDPGTLNQDMNGGNAPGQDGNTLELNDLNVYPNPSNAQVRISFSSTDMAPVELKISDMEGKTAWHETNASFSGKYDKTIDLGNQSKGIYFLEIIQNNKSMLKKLVIN